MQVATLRRSSAGLLLLAALAGCSCAASSGPRFGDLSAHAQRVRDSAKSQLDAHGAKLTSTGGGARPCLLGPTSRDTFTELSGFDVPASGDPAAIEGIMVRSLQADGFSQGESVGGVKRFRSTDGLNASVAVSPDGVVRFTVEVPCTGQ